jgi:hypothetical protein
MGVLLLKLPDTRQTHPWKVWTATVVPSKNISEFEKTAFE